MACGRLMTSPRFSRRESNPCARSFSSARINAWCESASVALGCRLPLAFAAWRRLGRARLSRVMPCAAMATNRISRMVTKSV
jgi:hypothetical protein